MEGPRQSNNSSWSKVKEVLEELHDGSSRHLGVKETMDKIRQQ
jgi:hypothetical protein